MIESTTQPLAKTRRQASPPRKAGATDRLPPHSPESERGVLGCALLDPEHCIAECLKALGDHGKAAFYDLRHQTIYETLAGMFNDQTPVDLVTVQQHLKDKNMLDQIGGIAYLNEIQDTVPSAANLSYYLDILREKYLLRKLIQTCSGVAGRLYDHQGELNGLFEEVEAELLGITRNQNSSLPDFIDCNAFVETDMPEPAQIVEGILHKGSKLVFGGSSKSFKTWSLLDLAISVSTGTPWLNRHTVPGKVLFVNFEIQPYAWKNRILKVAEAKQAAPRPGMLTIWNLRGHSADFRVLIPKIIAKANRENFSLIILDPIYKLYGDTDENAAGDVAELLNSIERLAAATGAAVAFGAHFAKGNAAGKEAIDRISGSGVFARDPDSILVFTKHEEEDAFTIEPILRNFAPVTPFVVRWDFPIMVPDQDLDPAKLRTKPGPKSNYSVDDILDLLPTDGLNLKNWLDSALKNGISRAAFFRLKKSLVSAKKIHLSPVSDTFVRI